MKVQKKGWMDETLMQVYIDTIWRPYIKRVCEEVGMTDDTSLLVLDSFKGHTNKLVVKKPEEENIEAPIIPWLYMYLQSAASRQLLKASWSQYIKMAVQKDKTAAKIPTATRQEVTNWVTKAWNAMKGRKELIPKSFQVCALIEASTDVIRNE